jgi:hypothetical protein
MVARARKVDCFDAGRIFAKLMSRFANREMSTDQFKVSKAFHQPQDPESWDFTSHPEISPGNF